ncbi:hypothetical protein Bca52824_039434 [Brassica carinata]|uniref:Uncharacterized protein n=1 Tax=Brassica carinata TaxID=52824 RepID=A0A8X7RTP5_BRACI|nr:hypothetical protein Bca52824_039434 [Brassica carinata]
MTQSNLLSHGEEQRNGEGKRGRVGGDRGGYGGGEGSTCSARNDTFEDIEMELDVINAAMIESGVDLETEEEFQTLSEEELEQASEAQAGNTLIQDEEQPVTGEENINKEVGTGDLAMRQSHRKRLFKPHNSTAGSTKMRMAAALVSPRRKVVAKVGARHGDNTKPPENKGPSLPKPVNLKF